MGINRSIWSGLRTGWPGHQRGQPPVGRATSCSPAPIPETTFVERGGVTLNAIPPNDFEFWETVNARIQDEDVGAIDPEILGHLAEIGIVKRSRSRPTTDATHPRRRLGRR